MNPRIVAPLLAVAAAAVTVQNAIFFGAQPDAASPEVAALAGGATAAPEAPQEPGAPEAPPPVSAEALSQWLAELRSAHPARSPFLTRDEAERLVARAAPQAEPREVAARPVLNGTLWSAGRRIAWIDGIPRAEGDDLGGRTVVRIEPGRVLLGGDAGDLVLEGTAAGGSGDAE